MRRRRTPAPAPESRLSRLYFIITNGVTSHLFFRGFPAGEKRVLHDVLAGPAKGSAVSALEHFLRPLRIEDFVVGEPLFDIAEGANLIGA